MASWRARAAGLSAAAALVLPLACLDPTEVLLHVTTDTLGLCARLSAVDFALGENPFAQKTNPACRVKEVGTVSFVPSGAQSDRFTVVVTGHLTGSNDTIIATRVVSFVSHTKLGLSVILEESCVNVTCKDGETCVHGACASARIGCDKDSTCGLDAGSIDAGTADSDAACSVTPPTDVGSTLRAAWHFDEATTSTTTTSSKGDQATITPGAALVPDAPAGCGNALGIVGSSGVTLLGTFASQNGVHVSFYAKRLNDFPVTLLTQFPATGNVATWRLGVDKSATLGVEAAMTWYPLALVADPKWHRVDLVWGSAGVTLGVDDAQTITQNVPYPGAGGAFDVGFAPPIGSSTAAFQMDELYLFSK